MRSLDTSDRTFVNLRRLRTSRQIGPTAGTSSRILNNSAKPSFQHQNPYSHNSAKSAMAIRSVTAALRRSQRSLLRSADPPMSAPARQPASAFRASARRAPHGPAAEDAGPSATAVAAVFRDGALLHWSLVLGNRTFSPEPLPWPALRGAIRAPGRSKRRPSMSAVPSASCSFFLLVHTPPCRFGAFSPTRRYRGDLQRLQPPSCRAALRCPALTRSRRLSRVTNGK